MNQLIKDFPTQLLEAIEIGKNAKIATQLVGKNIQNVLTAGLGGSGIGGNVAIDLVRSTLKLPMMVNKDYHLPQFVNENTLLIVSSYSGNTEETLAALEEGIQRKATIVCITSGGKIQKLASKHDLPIILLPANKPAPRACLGYSFIQQLFILHYAGLIKDDFIKDIENAEKLLVHEQANIQTQAQELSTVLADKLPIIYAPDGFESVAVRWRQQINENPKMLCWHNIIPEMNHNELVGWRTEDAQFAPIFFDVPNTFKRTAYRIKVNKNIIANYTPNSHNIQALGVTKVAQMLHLIHLGDWLSYYLAEQRKVDAMEIKVIDYLKAELAKL